MNITTVIRQVARTGKRRLASEQGFSLIIALSVITVTTLLAGAAYVAIQGDFRVNQHDLDGKRAYFAANAGVNNYLYQLNQNPDYWKICNPNNQQPVTLVPGASNTGVQYSFNYVLANGSTSCTSDAITSLIDKNTGTLRMKFIGYSGNTTTGTHSDSCPATSNANACRGIIASFRKDSPLDFLWYTVYEAFDSSINNFNGCKVFYRDGRSSACDINWISGDTMNGPMYTQDQYLISGSPTFGRAPSDNIESAAPGTKAANICSGNTCGSAIIKGTPVWGADVISPPADNSQLLVDAVNHGKVYTGTTTIDVDASTNTATVTNCPDDPNNPGCRTESVDITQFPIIYVKNTPGCSAPTYIPSSVTYNLYTSGTWTGYAHGCIGDAYIRDSSYTSSLTVAAANDIIVQGNITTTESGTPSVPSGNATLGLVANRFVRVQHGCSNGSNIANQFVQDIKLDAAILALQHSFIVDNYNCGTPLGNLTVNGAVAQYFRGVVGTSSNGQVKTGYIKKYTYDDRLRVTLPPYLFDIATSGWHVVRETLCDPGAASGSTAC